MTKEKTKRQSNVNVIDKEKPILKEPPMYAVLLLNDDITPMDMVVQVLQQIFGKSQSDAVGLMLHIHNTGKGICGIYTKDIAETKVLQVEHMASVYKFPLTAEMEEVK